MAFRPNYHRGCIGGSPPPLLITPWTQLLPPLRVVPPDLVIEFTLLRLSQLLILQLLLGHSFPCDQCLPPLPLVFQGFFQNPQFPCLPPHRPQLSVPNDFGYRFIFPPRCPFSQLRPYFSNFHCVILFWKALFFQSILKHYL